MSNRSNLMGKSENRIGEARIARGKDGVYRWLYEFNLLKNPSILLLIWKVLALSFGGVWIFETLLSIGDWNFWWEGFWRETKGFALLLAAMLALGFVAYLIYAALMGGKYCVLFEMDDKGITHTQIPKQFKKAQTLSAATVLLGLAAGNIGAVGSGLLAGSKQSMSSEWSKVKSVVSYPNWNTIKVNSLLNKNQVYAWDEDFEFIQQYIVEHCPNAKIRQ